MRKGDAPDDKNARHIPTQKPKPPKPPKKAEPP